MSAFVEHLKASFLLLNLTLVGLTHANLNQNAELNVRPKLNLGEASKSNNKYPSVNVACLTCWEPWPQVPLSLTRGVCPQRRRRESHQTLIVPVSPDGTCR